MDRHHDLSVKVAAVDGVVSEVFVELAIPVPVLHMLRDARFGWVFENAPVLILEVDHVDRRIELILRQRVTGRIPPLATFLTVSDGGFLLRSRPLARWGSLHTLRGRRLYRCRCYRGGGLGRLLVAFQHPEYPSDFA
ncbi:hypothetical protein PanWU01x14_275130 [Parasponia andersonii]|uniref:Uncharacterized protein n=1 Tax=Parasponia andersonii TaxID=3476 RepID=A0A2P5B3E2_PARAD|nr:hypothetical protein PanWU01x14_275130 [Parasponia andersonii]